MDERILIPIGSMSHMDKQGRLVLPELFRDFEKVLVARIAIAHTSFSLLGVIAPDSEYSEELGTYALKPVKMDEKGRFIVPNLLRKSPSFSFLSESESNQEPVSFVDAPKPTGILVGSDANLRHYVEATRRQNQSNQRSHIVKRKK